MYIWPWVTAWWVLFLVLFIEEELLTENHKKILVVPPTTLSFPPYIYPSYIHTEALLFHRPSRNIFMLHLEQKKNHAIFWSMVPLKDLGSILSSQLRWIKSKIIVNIRQKVLVDALFEVVKYQTKIWVQYIQLTVTWWHIWLAGLVTCDSWGVFSTVVLIQWMSLYILTKTSFFKQS